jgi:hypothetical protein
MCKEGIGVTLLMTFEDFANIVWCDGHEVFPDLSCGDESHKFPSVSEVRHPMLHKIRVRLSFQ